LPDSFDSLHLALAATVLALGVVVILSRHLRRDFRRTLQELPVGLCTVNAQHEITLWNAEMAKLTGISSRTARGRRIGALPRHWRDALGEALARPEGDFIKRHLGEEDDQPRWVIVHSSRARGNDNKRAVLVDDISDYQRLQDELLHRERLASIGRLAAGVAHEIGNPVTGIACLAQNLRDAGGDPEVTQGAEEILKQTHRISRIVNSLVQFSHSGGQTPEVSCRPCNLADCVDEAIHLLSLDRDAPGAQFSNRCDRELLVFADQQLLLQVFINLLDNARAAAGGTGAVEIDASGHDEVVHVHVDNTGPAIDPGVLSKVFEPFFTTKDVGSGTGLGLPLVRGMVEDMGGSVELLSPCPSAGDSGARAALRLRRGHYADDDLGA
jgi:PAS domain S-box-containing protein